MLGSVLRAAVVLDSDPLVDELACLGVLIQECSRDVSAASDGRDSYFRMLTFHLPQRIPHTVEHDCGGGMTRFQRGHRPVRYWCDGHADASQSGSSSPLTLARSAAGKFVLHTRWK